jgi:hypothetical protein
MSSAKYRKFAVFTGQIWKGFGEYQYFRSELTHSGVGIISGE